jgi:sensor domain CHASE-containing protein
MRIRKKALTIVGLTVLVLMAVMITSTYFVVTERFARLEAREVETQVRRVQNELKATLTNLEATAADWAPWDDTYEFIQGANPTYEQNNLVDSTFANLRLNFMLFFDKQGRLVYAGFPETRTGSSWTKKRSSTRSGGSRVPRCCCTCMKRAGYRES